jgi:hypothetical protein
MMFDDEPSQDALKLSKLRSKSKSSIFFEKIAKSDDPLKHLGVGISTFHQLLIMLFALFFVLFLLHIPVKNNFESYDYYANADNAGLILGSSLGNMGFSETKCASTSMM